MAGVHIAAACEAVTFAKAMNLDLAKVCEVITASAGKSSMFENRAPHILEGDYAPRSAVDIFTKDLGIVADMGRRMQFPTPIASMALQMFVMTAAAGTGPDDDTSGARMLAGLAGLDLPQKELAMPRVADPVQPAPAIGRRESAVGGADGLSAVAGLPVTRPGPLVLMW